MVLQVLFWVLLVLLGVGVFGPSDKYPWLGRASGIVLLILLAILAFFAFGNPIHR